MSQYRKIPLETLAGIEIELREIAGIARRRDRAASVEAMDRLTSELRGRLAGLEAQVAGLISPAATCPVCDRSFRPVAGQINCGPRCTQKKHDQKRAGTDARRKQLREAQRRFRARLT